MILTPKDLRIIRSSEFLRTEPFSSNAEQNLDEARGWFTNRNIRLVEKRRREPFKNKTTTLVALGQVRLSRGFWTEKPTTDQTEVLWHEAVHVRQKVRAVRWPSARYRLRAEVPAYRETVRVFMAHLGYPVGSVASARAIAQMNEVADNIVTSLRVNYLVGVLHRETMGRQIRAALTCDFAPETTENHD